MDRLGRRHVDRIMLALLIASSAAANSPQVRTAVDLCRPVLARKAGGEIATIDVTAFTVGRKEIAVRGRVTIFAGMGPPAAGSQARTTWSVPSSITAAPSSGRRSAPLR